MLGWHISVYRQQNGGSAPALFGAPQGPCLAVWQTGVNGLEWIDELVAQKKAIALGGNGYPMEYTVMAADIIEQLRNGPPLANALWSSDAGDILTSAWHGKTFKDEKAMVACGADEWLLIQAWDES